jgi:SAM-dependent methyltransferase
MRRITWALLGDERGRLLDVGCGPEWGRIALPPGVWGVGLDREDHFIGRPSSTVRGPAARTVRSEPESFVQADAGILPLRAGSFDLVLALDLLEQQGVKPDAVLQEIRRVMRPGGCLLARVPAHPGLYGPHDRNWGGARRYRKAELEALMRGAGFNIRRLTYANGFVFPFAVLVRLGGRAGLLRGDLLGLAQPFGGLILRALSLEARWLRRRDLPIGLSLVCLAEA